MRSVPFLAARLALAVAMCTMALGSAVAASKPLVYCAEASPEGFDPGLWDSSSTSNATNQIFQGLLAFRRGGTELDPALAESWRMSADGREFSFKLRRGVRFHDNADFRPTREFNADDVLFTFGRFVDAEHPFNKAYPANFIYPTSLGLAAAIAGIDRLGDHEIRFRLRQPNVIFPTYLAMSFAGIQSAEYGSFLLASGKPERINTRPIGTGPFRFKSYKKDDVLRLQAHPGYWGRPQRTENLIFTITREPNVRVQKLLAGECHVSSPLRDLDVAALQKRPELQVMARQALNISYLSYNLRKAPLDRREVREALDIAIDRDALFRAMFPRGDAQQATSAFPPAIPGHNGRLKNEFDPVRARQLLAQAGLPEGFDLELWALPVARPTNPNGQLMAQMIQQDWARIGVRASIKTYEWGEYLKRANKGEHGVYMSGWSGDTGDADDFLAPNLSCAANPGGIKFCNREFDRLLDQARATVDAAERRALYERAQDIFKRERPWSPIAHSMIYMPLRRDVEGFLPAPNGSVDFEDVYRSEGAKK